LPILLPATDRGRNRDTPRDVERISGQDFDKEFANEYRQGQHKTSLGPTGRGKTTSDHRALKRIITPDHPAVILAGKPPGRDARMAEAAKYLNLKVTEEWPPASKRLDKMRGKNGYVLRPHHTMTDIDLDNANMREQFRRAMLDCYGSKTPVIIVVDEVHHVENDLKLKKESEAALMRGGPINASWGNVQRGAYVSYHRYGAPEWLRLYKDPVVQNQQRYKDIGGVDPELLIYLNNQLRTQTVKSGQTVSESIVIRRSGPQIMIVGMD
jgi:hypothetical protein